MSSIASAWEARPKGYILKDDAIVGTVTEGRALVETLNVQEATIEAQQEALEETRQSLMTISGDLAIARNRQDETDQKLAQLADTINASIVAAQKEGRAKGHKDAVKVGGVLVVIGGIVGLLAK